MKQLYINGRFLSQKTTGVQRYAQEITKELLKHNSQLQILVPPNCQIPIEFQEKCLEIGSKKGTLWEQIDLPRFLKKKQATVLNLCNTAPLFFARNLVTIHDCSVFANPSWFSFRFRIWYKFLLPRIARKALHIYTVSYFSKNEISTNLNVSLEKISVIYPGIQKSFLPQEKAATKEHLILHIGTISERKNISTIISGFKAAKLEDYRLIFCGDIDSNLKNRIQQVNDRNIQFIPNCSDETLLFWLKKAQFIINASHYEGFGIPVLEGIVNGAFPLVSSIPVFTEWLKENAYYFDPNSYLSVKETLTLAAQINPVISEEIKLTFCEIHNYNCNTILLWNNLITHLKK